MNERSVLKRFKNEIGMTPSDYPLLARPNLSSRMLVESRLPVDKVARRCEIGSGRQLAKLFRKYLTTTPTQLPTTGCARRRRRTAYPERAQLGSTKQSETVYSAMSATAAPTRHRVKRGSRFCLHAKLACIRLSQNGASSAISRYASVFALMLSRRHSNDDPIGPRKHGLAALGLKPAPFQSAGSFLIVVITHPRTAYA